MMIQRYSVRIVEVPRGEGFLASVYRGRYMVGESVATSRIGALRGAVGHTRRRRRDGAFRFFDQRTD